MLRYDTTRGYAMRIAIVVLSMGLLWVGVAIGQTKNAGELVAHCAELMDKPELRYRTETFDRLSSLDEMDACRDEPDVLHRRVCLLELRESRHRELLVALWTRYAMEVDRRMCAQVK